MYTSIITGADTSAGADTSPPTDKKRTHPLLLLLLLRHRSLHDLLRSSRYFLHHQAHTLRARCVVYAILVVAISVPDHAVRCRGLGGTLQYVCRCHLVETKEHGSENKSA